MWYDHIETLIVTNILCLIFLSFIVNYKLEIWDKIYHFSRWFYCAWSMRLKLFVNGSWNRLFLDIISRVLSRFNDSKDEDDVVISSSRFTIQIQRLWIVSNGWMGLFLSFWGILKIVTILFFFTERFIFLIFPSESLFYSFFISFHFKSI